MPVFSLPSKGGIGTLGQDAYNFVDFLSKSGQSWWQILPLNPTNYGDSPYQSFSSYAGNPYFIDPQFLIDEGLITEEEFCSFDFGDNSLSVDYEKLYKSRIKLLKIAFSRFKGDDDYLSFCDDNSSWLYEYALFMTIKNLNNDLPWYSWEHSLKIHDANAIEAIKKENQDSINFYCFVQYKFFMQWFKLKQYANDNGIGIIGDIPIYVAYDSADIWSEPGQFLLDKDLSPTMVAGCPPDAFSKDGQLWGNPIYNWKHMKNDGYDWWKRRTAHAFKLYDKVRIDHFRGFEAYYAIPFEANTAADGKWLKGPDIELFDELKKEFGADIPIIAEDLGFLTDDVLEMLRKTGFPGMKVLQFAFDSREDNDYLPHNYHSNCVVYTGTHDNDTIMGWARTADSDDVAFARKYLNYYNDDGFNWAMIKTAMMSVAETCIITMQDIIGLGSEGRINTPSTLGGNWTWRIESGCINDWLANIVYENTKTYGRLQQKTDRTN